MADSSKDFIEEFRLAQDMKDTCCDESGKETNPAKAADILYQIGLIYRKRSPDKISLIKSAGLLNAAIVRNPPNVSQIKSDLSELCLHILKIAGAETTNANLVKTAESLKAKIIEMRQEVRELVDSKLPKSPDNESAEEECRKFNFDKISAIRTINNKIGEKYMHIMVKLAKFCEVVMGKPPCEYAIVGMGSLAREEITPYSDFEHIILQFDDKNCKTYLEYFKWFSVIFHVIVLNFQETIIPSLNISCLNDKEFGLGDWFYDDVTPRGISFDGMMPHACKFPLGRQQHTKNKKFTTELIKPVSEMLEYLSSEADLKHGYHLADILTKTCFVFGNEDIFKQFVKGAQKYHKTKSKTDTINDIKKQVREDLNNFSTRFRLTTLKSQDTINIKQLVYRSTTIFISALARKHNISANSCFDIIDQMAENKQITQNTAEKLRCAIAIACEMRLRVYMDKNSQCDNAIDLKQNGIANFLEIVGTTSTINYFQIAYCLQCEVAKQLHFTKLHFYSDPKLINVTIGLAFGMKNLTSFNKEFQHYRSWDSSKFDFDECIKQLETKTKSNAVAFKRFSHKISKKVTKMFKRSSIRSSSQSNLNVKQIKSVAEYLFSADIFDEALDFYKQLLNVYENQSKNVDNQDYNLAWVNYQIGYCLRRLNHETEALTYYGRALEIYQSQTDTDNDLSFHEEGYDHITSLFLNGSFENIAMTLHEIGRCHIGLYNYDKALKHLKQALEIEHNTTLNADTDRSIALTLHEIGRCHINLFNYNEALSNLNKALEIFQKRTLNVETERNISAILYCIGLCHIDLQNYGEAFTYLNETLEVEQNTSIDVDVDRDMAATYCDIGRCLSGLQQHDDSWSCLEQSLKIFRTTTLDERKDIDLANTLNSMGECLIRKQLYVKALDYLQDAREIYQTQNNVEKSIKLATALYNTASCHTELQRHADAFDCLKKSLDIYQRLPLHDHNTDKIGTLQAAIDKCLLKLS